MTKTSAPEGEHEEAAGTSEDRTASPRLDAYMARSQSVLDLLALSTLWIVLVPPSDFGGAASFATAARLALSVVYGIDMAIRAALVRRHVRYLRDHPLGLAAVAFPPVRVLFSVRLVTSVFRRGNLVRFLIAASVLVLDGAVIVFLYERDAPGASIHTLGESLWWSVTTVTTVGYGDYAPVTVAGRLVATFIMVIGILTIAVITAQVASTFMTQAGAHHAAPSADGGSPVADDERLARIEAMLVALSARDAPAAPAPPQDASG